MAFSLLQDRSRSAVRPDGARRYTGPERRAPARNGFMHRATESFGLSRLFMFFLTGFVAYLGSVPGTLNAKAFDGAGAYWWAVAMIALLGTVDTVVNDLMPDKYRFQSVAPPAHHDHAMRMVLRGRHLSLDRE